LSEQYIVASQYRGTPNIIVSHYQVSYHLLNFSKKLTTIDVLIGQTPTQSSIGNEKNTMCYTSRVGFYFNIIYCPITCSIPNLIFSLFPFDDCQNLQWRLGLVWLWRQNSTGKLVHKCLLELVCLSSVTKFIYNVSEYIYADGISAFWWFYHSNRHGNQ